jgi:hypothetical protein
MLPLKQIGTHAPALPRHSNHLPREQLACGKTPLGLAEPPPPGYSDTVVCCGTSGKNPGMRMFVTSDVDLGKRLPKACVAIAQVPTLIRNTSTAIVKLLLSRDDEGIFSGHVDAPEPFSRDPIGRVGIGEDDIQYLATAAAAQSRGDHVE